MTFSYQIEMERWVEEGWLLKYYHISELKIADTNVDEAY